LTHGLRVSTAAPARCIGGVRINSTRISILLIDRPLPTPSTADHLLRIEEQAMTGSRKPANTRHPSSEILPAAERAPAHRVVPTAGSDSPRLQHQARTISQLFGPAAGGVLQRNIHQHTGQAGWKIVEPGTAGLHVPGEPEKGVFFNDVTGVHGASADAVRAGLADRLMHVGSLPELSDQLALQWGPLADKLGKYAQRTLKEIKAEKVGKDSSDRLINVGSLYLTDLDHPEFDKTTARCLMPQGDIAECATFVYGLMKANGQLDHIRRAPWWKQGGLRVRVDMNYYHNRPLDKLSRNVGMHKDTAGDNLFVNLVFGNTAATPATEWTQDRVAIAGKKLLAMQKKGVPDGMLQEIQQAKTLLSNVDAPGKRHVEGGVMPTMAFVSWVDELAWHATPSLLNRLKLKKDDLPQVAAWFKDPARITTTKGGPDTFMAVLGLLHGQDPSLFERTGFLELHYVDDGSDVQDWYEQAFKPEARAGLLEQWEKVLEAEQAKRSGLLGNTLDGEQEEFVEQPDKSSSSSSAEEEPALYQTTDISGRPRRNSDAETQQEVKEAADAQGLRSFIRTWVRIEPNG
jgi:hypothetical protein